MLLWCGLCLRRLSFILWPGMALATATGQVAAGSLGVTCLPMAGAAMAAVNGAFCSDDVTVIILGVVAAWGVLRGCCGSTSVYRYVTVRAATTVGRPPASENKLLLLLRQDDGHSTIWLWFYFYCYDTNTLLENGRCAESLGAWLSE